MFVYRISKKEYCKDLSGIGAGLFGGRWNPRGVNMVYTSSSIALASLEYMVHNYHLLSTAKVCLTKIEISSSASITTMLGSNLPVGWDLQMSKQLATQTIGKDFFLKGDDYGLRVPSAVVPDEFNILLNPMHTDHSNTKIVKILDPFVFDQRLLKL